MKNTPLAGKKMLFFCPRMFGYEKEIQAEIERMGADVTYHSDIPFQNLLVKGFIRFFTKFALPFSDRFHSSWLRKQGPSICDIIFIMKGEGLSSAFIKTLRHRYPKALIIMYLSDSISNVLCTESKLPYIDEVFSFDPDDCVRFRNFNYRPLFFLNRYLEVDERRPNRKIFFVGTLNGDRSKVISRLLVSLKDDVVFDYWLFVRNNRELFFQKIVDQSIVSLDSSRLLFIPMSFEDITRHLNDCSAVLDIEHPKQAGLTMRTFEVIASGRKLITTNPKIRDHEFYDPRRICIIDRNSPLVPLDFFSVEPPALSSEFVSRYCLRGWLLDVLHSSCQMN